MITEYRLPNVPDQLQTLLTDDVLDVHERWQSYSLKDIKATMPVETIIDLGDRGAAAVMLEPKDGEIDTNKTIVLGLPYQQAWKPSMYVRAEFTRQIIAPNSRMLVLPNNSVTRKYMEFTDEELQRMGAGDLSPYYENQTRVTEAFGIVGKALLSGYSLGGLTVLGIAATGSNKFEVAMVNCDESPNKERTSKQLQKDFVASGGPKDQRAAIKNSALPALSSALNIPRMLVDYTRFGVASLDETSKAINAGMASPGFVRLIELAQRNISAERDVAIKLGYVAGSKLFDPEIVTTDMVVEYSGDAAQMHATGDNPVAHALMLKHALAA